MQRNRIIAAVAASITSAVLCIGAVAATQALAAYNHKPRLGNFKTWPAAQSAAGFRLLMPASTFGLKINGDITVTRCLTKKLIKKKKSARLVIANYDPTPRAALEINQNNSGGPCRSLGAVRRLGSYQVDGVKAALVGECGRKPFNACSSRKIWMFLSWRRGGIYYMASSYGESVKTIVAFARGLKPVR